MSRHEIRKAKERDLERGGPTQSGFAMGLGRNRHRMLRPEENRK